MKRYKFFALDGNGRVDRGFDSSLPGDAAAVAFAGAIDGAAKVEILQEGRMIASILFGNGKAIVIGG